MIHRPMFEKQVSSLERFSPVSISLRRWRGLPLWLMSHVLVRERDFDGALGAVDRAVKLAPYDTFMLSSLMMVLVQAGRPEQALHWADQVAARDPALGWSDNHRRGWAYLALNRFGEAVDALRQTEFNDAHLLLAIAYVRLGSLDDARAEVGKMTKINPAITSQGWRLGHPSETKRSLSATPCVCAIGLAEETQRQLASVLRYGAR